MTFVSYFVFILLIISVLLVIFRVRSFGIVLGLGIFWIMIADRVQFSNSLSYAACMSILCGFVRENTQWAFQVQVSLLYFGAGLNKSLDTDWLNGQYFENFALNIFHIPFYAFFSEKLPELWLAKCLSYSVILFELGASVAFLFKIKIFYTILIAYIFHGVMLMMTKGVLSILFFYLMGCSFILLIDYPKPSILVNYSSRFQFIMEIFKMIDFDQSFVWKKENSKLFCVEMRGKGYTSLLAFLKLFLYHKYAHFLFLLVLALFFKAKSFISF